MHYEVYDPSPLFWLFIIEGHKCQPLKLPDTEIAKIITCFFQDGLHDERITKTAT